MGIIKWLDEKGNVTERTNGILPEQKVYPFRYEKSLRPYHDAFRWYNMPKYNSTDPNKDGKQVSTEDAERFGISPNGLLVGPDNWQDPSENGLNWLVAGGLGGLRAAPAIANVLKPETVLFKGGQAFSKYFAAPYVAGTLVDEGEKALTGTTASKLFSNWLLNKGWNSALADFTGGFLNPGYWINFGGAGRYTKPLFNKIGLGLSSSSAYSTLTPELTAKLFPKKSIKEKFTTINLKIILPSINLLDKNLYKFQAVANPWYPLTKGTKQVTTADLPSFKFVKNSEELSDKGTTIDYLLSNSNTTNQKLFGKAIELLKPNINIKFYSPDLGYAAFDTYALPLLAGASAADIAAGDEDRNPYIRGLEYFLLGRYGINSLAKHRLMSTINNVDKYRINFDNISVDLDDKFNSLTSKLYTLNGHHRIWSIGSNSSPIFVPKDYPTTITKKGFNYKHASFDNLLSFLDKHNGIVRDNLNSLGKGYEHKFTIDNSRNVVYDEFGRIIAKRGDNGKIIVTNELSLKNILSKDIDIIDYATGNKYTGQISIGEDGTVNIPEEYTNILKNNINYVLNVLFPGSGIKVFGSSAGVIDAGFPHATHDIDFYITRLSLDNLINKGMLSENNRINPGTYTYKLKPQLFGEQGNIDLNVIDQTPEGMATGLRAEELYRQYFPDEYFLALRQHQAAMLNKEIPYDAPLTIRRTPLELLDAVTPSSKTIMDSFDIDISNPTKSKHTLRSWAHLIYSDPKQVALGLNQYAKSMVGSNANLFPINVTQLGDKELNLQALKKIGINLTDSELNRIASDPQRMKNVLDAWYLMDNTAMRYIRGTWPGTQGNSANNFIKSATIWDPINNHGNGRGAGLNTAIGGDSEFGGDLKAFILPRSEYKSTNLLDLIDEINNNFGRNQNAKLILLDITWQAPRELQVSKLLNIYNSYGWNFLQDGDPYGRGMYASATRPFDVKTDAVGFLKAGLTGPRLHSMLSRLKLTEKDNPLTKTGYGATFLANRVIDKPIDFNIAHLHRLYDFLNINSNRLRLIDSPFTFKDKNGTRSTLYSSDFVPFKLDAILAGIPIGLSTVHLTIKHSEDKSNLDAIKSFINKPDKIILGMPELDRKKFTLEGVDSLYLEYRTNPLSKDENETTINRYVYYELLRLYNKYASKLK